MGSRIDGKCVGGRGNMLVDFGGELGVVNVVGKRLRRVTG